MRILFTCVGTSDPVRDFHDGPMLHILRHYRPDKVCVFMSGEMAKMNRKDNRIGITAEFIRTHWDGYSPNFELISTDISDPSDMDAVSIPITEKVVKLASLPDAEVLLNLSSGTPQMKIVLCMLACDTRFNTVGVQVKNHENASGKSDRTIKDDYDVRTELELDEDEKDGNNRCVEPELLHIERQQKKDQIIALIEQRNYSAVYAMKNAMPDNLKALVGHLDARDSMQSELAHNRAQSLKLPFSLYPKKEVRVYRGHSDYDEVSEAYLILLNRQHRKQYEEMVLRLNPLIVRLEMRLIRNALDGMGMKPEDIIYKPYSARPHFYPEMLEDKLPEVYEQVSSDYPGGLRDSDINMGLCLNILKRLPNATPEVIDLLEKCGQLNDACRNDLAHQLCSVSAEQCIAYCGMQPAQLLNEIGKLIALLYPECDRSLFTIYKRCGDYIKDKLV